MSEEDDSTTSHRFRVTEVTESSTPSATNTTQAFQTAEEDAEGGNVNDGEQRREKEEDKPIMDGRFSIRRADEGRRPKKASLGGEEGTSSSKRNTMSKKEKNDGNAENSFQPVADGRPTRPSSADLSKGKPPRNPSPSPRLEGQQSQPNTQGSQPNPTPRSQSSKSERQRGKQRQSGRKSEVDASNNNNGSEGSHHHHHHHQQQQGSKVEEYEQQQQQQQQQQYAYYTQHQVPQPFTQQHQQPFPPHVHSHSMVETDPSLARTFTLMEGLQGELYKLSMDRNTLLQRVGAMQHRIESLEMMLRSEREMNEYMRRRAEFFEKSARLANPGLELPDLPLPSQIPPYQVHKHTHNVTSPPTHTMSNGSFFMHQQQGQFNSSNPQPQQPQQPQQQQSQQQQQPQQSQQQGQFNSNPNSSQGSARKMSMSSSQHTMSNGGNTTNTNNSNA